MTDRNTWRVKIDSDHLQEMIGTVKETSAIHEITHPVSSFTHTDKIVHTIRPVSKDQAWTTYYGEKEFVLMDRTGAQLQSVQKEYSSSWLYFR